MASPSQMALRELFQTLGYDLNSADPLVSLLQDRDYDAADSADMAPMPQAAPDLAEMLPSEQSSTGVEARIRDIQGTGLRSPLVNRTVVNVPGIVTAVASNGFYLQDPNPDHDAASSEGIFVFTGPRSSTTPPPVRIGESIQVSGRVLEFRAGSNTNTLTTTQIGNTDNRPTITILSSGNPLPAATLIGAGGRVPPTEIISPDGILFYESLEGMRVTVQNPVAVSPTSIFSSNSEIWTVADRGVGATGMNQRDGITISANDFNPERIQLDDGLLDGFSAPPVNVGDRLGNATGVISYGFGNYEVLVTEPFSRISGGLQPEVTNLVGTADQLTIASYNVENLNPFTGVRFEALGAHVVTNLKSPDVIALQEVQDNNGPINDGTVDASLSYQGLINAIVEVGGPTYRFTDIAPANNRDGGQAGANIRVGYLYNPARVSLVEESVRRITDPELGDAAGNAFIASRKPLVATFKFNGQDVTLINNHLTARSGSDPLFGAVQPPVISRNDQRVAQAEILNAEVDKILAAKPDANVVVLGDLNGFSFENFQQILKGGETPILANLHDTLPASERYSYIFQGNTQALDHILVTNNLVNKAKFDPVHVNSEFVGQASDHDPLLVSLNLPSRSTLPTPPQSGSFTLQLLHASDQEAGVPAFRDIPGFSAVMNALSGKYENSIKLTSGDLYITSPFLNASIDIYDNARTGNPAGQAGIANVLISNQLGWDAASVGNHEFSGGDSTLFNLVAPNANWVNGVEGGVGISTGGYPGTSFPYLANNLDYSRAALSNGLVVPNGDAPLPNTLTGSVVEDVNGEKVGVIGIVTPYLESIASIGRVEVTTDDGNGNAITPSTPISVQVDSIIDNITAEVNALTTAGVNKIILMTHLQEAEIEQALAQRMAELGIGVDILIGGGAHRVMANGAEVPPLREDETQQTTPLFLQPYPQPYSSGNNTVYYVKTGSNYRYLSQLVATFDEKGVITSIGEDSNAYATDIAGVARLYGEDITTLDQVKAKADPEIVKIVEGVQAFVDIQDGNIFGQTAVFLNGLRDNARTRETNLGSLAADSQAYYAEAYLKEYNLLPGFNQIDIAFRNGGSIRDSIGQPIVETFTSQVLQFSTEANPEVGKEAGDISQLDIANSLRFNGVLAVGTVSAAGLLDIAEHMVSAVELGSGRFGQVSGFRFSFDPSAPALDRVQNLALTDAAGMTRDTLVQNGQLVGDPTRTFSVATVTGLATGAIDGYPPLDNVINLSSFDEPDSLNRANLVSGAEQDALAEYLAAFYSRENGQAPFAQADTTQSGNQRVQNLAFRDDTVLTGSAAANACGLPSGTPIASTQFAMGTSAF